MSVRKVVTSDKGLKSPLFSQAIVHNGTVYVSGNIGIDTATMRVVEGGVADRTRQALLNIQTVLEEAGSSLQNIIKVRDLRRIVAETDCIVQHIPYRYGQLCGYEPCLYVYFCPSFPSGSDKFYRRRNDQGSETCADLCLRQGTTIQDRCTFSAPL